MLTSPRLHSLVVLLCLSISILAGPARATWDSYTYSTALGPFSQGPNGPMLSVDDGQGGVLVACGVDDGTGFQQLYVQRINRVGTPLWRPGAANGILIPYEVTANFQAPPYALASDGAGGAWLADRVGLADTSYLRLTHVSADGSTKQSHFVGVISAPLVFACTSMDPEQGLQVELVPTSSTDVLVVWTMVGGSGPSSNRLGVARVGVTQGVEWNATVANSVTLCSQGRPFRVASDDGDGVWILWDDIPQTGSAAAQYLQRVNAMGQKILAAGGQPFLPGGNYADAMVPDGVGGVYAVSRTSSGQVRADRFNSIGVSAWAANAPYVFSITLQGTWTRDYAPDGENGFWLASADGDARIQRVLPDGTLAWPLAGIELGEPGGTQTDIAVCSDESGGASIIWADDNQGDYLNSGDAIRVRGVDSNGQLSYSQSYILWPSDYDGPAVPRTPRLVSDGAGGAYASWIEQTGPGYADPFSVLTKPMWKNGAERSPHFDRFLPNAASPGDVVSFRIEGDYLDPDLNYRLRDVHTYQSYLLQNVTSSDFHSLDATVDFAGGIPGTLRLEIYTDNVTFYYDSPDFGLGPAPPCDGGEAQPLDPITEPPLVGPDPTFDVAYGGSDLPHVAWIETDGSAYRIFYSQPGATPRGSGVLVYEQRDPIRELSIVASPSEDVYVVAVVEVGGQDRVRAFALDRGGNPSPVLAEYAASGYVDGLDATYDFHRGGIYAAFANHALNDELVGWSVDPGGGSQSFTGWAPDGREPQVAATNLGIDILYVRNGSNPDDPAIRLSVMDQDEAFDSYPVAGSTSEYTVRSPALAFDGSERTVVAWVVDTPAEDQVWSFYQERMGTFQAVQFRKDAAPQILEIELAGDGRNTFHLLERQSDGSPNSTLVHRIGSGESFFVPVDIASNVEAVHPCIAGNRQGPGSATLWYDYGDGLIHASVCNAPVSTASAPVPIVASEALIATPNPFNPSTSFHFELDQTEGVRLQIFDVRGRLVRDLRTGRLGPGAHQVQWNGEDDQGHAVASGVYLARMLTSRSKRVRVTRVALVK